MSINRFGLRRPTWQFLPWFGQVGNTGMRAHEDITGVQVSLQKVLLGFTNVDASEGRFWEGVGWHECEAVQSDLVDTVDGLSGNKASCNSLMNGKVMQYNAEYPHKKRQFS